MKIIIEDEDVRRLKEMVKECGILFTDEQARKFLEEDVQLCRDILIFGIDTEVREQISHILVENIMEGNPDNKREYGYRWEWPCYGDSDEYSNEFYEKFYKFAKEKGYEVSEKRNDL